jgi:hypothetical protein
LELSSRGGNYLLNVGPDKQGTIHERFQAILAEAGKWMAVYGETIYGTEKNNLVNPFEYGYVTQKKENNGIHWYLHVSPVYWAEKEIILPGITELPQKAVLFETKEPVNVQLKDNNLIISLPDNCPNPYYATLDLYFTGNPNQIAKSGIRNSTIRLTPFQATTSDVKKDSIPYTFRTWARDNSEVEFNIFMDAGEYTVEAEYASWCYDNGEIYFTIDGNNYTGYYKSTGKAAIPNDMNNFIRDSLGGIRISLPESKMYSIKIKRNAEIPNATNWLNVRYFYFKKSDPGSINDSINTTISQVRIYPNLIKKGYFTCESPEMQTFRIHDFSGRCHKSFTVTDKSRDINVKELQPEFTVSQEAISHKRLLSPKT